MLAPVGSFSAETALHSPQLVLHAILAVQGLLLIVNYEATTKSSALKCRC